MTSYCIKIITISFSIMLTTTCSTAEHTTNASLVGCPVEEFPAGTDYNLLRQIDKRCRELYGPDACLRRLIERSELNYWAVCGHEKRMHTMGDE